MAFNGTRTSGSAGVLDLHNSSCSFNKTSSFRLRAWFIFADVGQTLLIFNTSCPRACFHSLFLSKWRGNGRETVQALLSLSVVQKAARCRLKAWHVKWRSAHLISFRFVGRTKVLSGSYGQTRTDSHTLTAPKGAAQICSRMIQEHPCIFLQWAKGNIPLSILLRPVMNSLYVEALLLTVGNTTKASLRLVFRVLRSHSSFSWGVLLWVVVILKIILIWGGPRTGQRRQMVTDRHVNRL